MFTNPSIKEKKWVSESFTTESGSQIHMPALAGVYTSTLSGTILHDNIGTDEPFSAQLTLISRSVSQVFQVHAQPDGSYAFTGLKPDTYTLQVTLPENLVFGQLDNSPIAPQRSNQATAEITFKMGDAWENADILASLPVTLTGQVFNDDNLTGKMEEDEYGAEGRELALLMNGQEVARTQSGENGAFFFDRLIPGNYELMIETDESEELVKMSGASQGENCWTLPLSLLKDGNVTLPIMRYASVSGSVWSLDGTTNGVSGLSVSLLNEKAQIVDTVETDENGAYTFRHLLPGSYSLYTILPTGYLFARPQDTANRESYVLGQPDGTPNAQAFWVIMGDDMSGMDIGMGAMGGIGDRAWLDENGNGLQDIGEPGVPGVVIQLFRNGELIASATTDVYGRYLIPQVYPGEYEVRCQIPAELMATKRDETFPLVNSLLYESKDETPTGSVVVPSGGVNLHCDVGFQLRKKGVYPAVMDTIPVKDWRPYSDRGITE